MTGLTTSNDANRTTPTVDGTQEHAQEQDGVLQRMLGWLRAGYPSGVPQQDYIVLLGLLRRSLTETEVEEIAVALTRQDPDQEGITSDQIEDMIKESVLQPAAAEDVARVSSHLAAGGWPLATPER